MFECRVDAQSDGPFACDCDGRTLQQSAVDCKAALTAACNVDAERPEDYCTYETLGTCWPGDARGFRCECIGADGVLIERAEESCDEALFRACGAPCEDETGRCEPLADANGFECECEVRTVTKPGEIECVYAIDAACHPECEHAGGQCYLASDYRGLECRCGDDPELTTILYESVGHDDCEGILSDVCGPDPDVPEGCERSGANGSGSCRVQNGGGFWCSCTTADSESAGGGSEVAETCLEQLMQFCPEAFE